MLKRLFDILLAAFGILISLPLLPVLALLIKLDTKGSVFYSCSRVGKDGNLFKMYKFRTMYETPQQYGPSISAQGDPRVTPIGSFLRRTKLNELPQFFNVLKGDMTVVGPRPEAPDLAALYPPHAQAIFDVKPGLVGPNQILGRNEEDWYPPEVDPQQYYIDVILPQKLPLDLEYVRHASLMADLKYIVLAVKETIFKALTWELVLRNRSQLNWLFADIGLSSVSFVLAHILRSAGSFQPLDITYLLTLLPVVAIARIPFFVYWGLNKTLVRHFAFYDMVSIVKSVTAGSYLLISFFTFLLNVRKFSRAVFFIDWFCLILLMIGLRYILQLWRKRHPVKDDDNTRHVLIFGAGDAGALVYQFLTAHKSPVFDVRGFLDDDPAKRHKTLYGRKILGNRFSLGPVVDLYQINEIVLAIPSAPAHEIAAIEQTCHQAGVRCWAFPKLPDMLPVTYKPTAEATLAELIETPDIPLDETAAHIMLRGKRVLVTGVGSAFSLELCRQILRFRPEKLIVVDRYEAYLTELVLQLTNSSADRIVPVLFPPGRNDKVRQVFLEYQPDIVVHTAARKYSPAFDLQDDNILQANYLSTFELARQARDNSCKYFVMISSDEAAKQGTCLSDTLRAAEISLQQFFASQRTTLVTVRLGNILENLGGLVTLLEEQIAGRESVTLPHPNAAYYFLSKQSAVNLVLQSVWLTRAHPDNEGIFVCNYGPPLALLDVANTVAMHHGVRLESDIPVTYLRDIPSEDEPVIYSDDAKDVQFDHLNISLLRDCFPSGDPEVVAAVHHLLNLHEEDIAHTVWEDPTRTLLHLTSTTSRSIEQ